jgi:hypothetical protein
MGTNYFSIKRGLEDLEPDAFWDRRRDDSGDILHIGKSSGGWCFSLHVIPELGINDLWDWFDTLLDPDRIIISEYQDPVEFSEMIRIITGRASLRQNTWSEEDFRRNCAEPGPNNLARHALGKGCVKQGIGTWDCIEGYFS